MDIKNISRDDAIELFKVCKNKDTFIRHRHYYLSTSSTIEDANLYWNRCIELLKENNYENKRDNKKY